MAQIVPRHPPLRVVNINTIFKGDRIVFETTVLDSRQEFASRSDSIKLGEDSNVGDRTESEP